MNTEKAVANKTPDIPIKCTKERDNTKLIIVSVIAQCLVSLYRPPAATNIVVSNFTIKINNIKENDKAIRKLVSIAFS